LADETETIVQHLECYMEAGKYKFPVAHFVANFSLNEIPDAVVSLALGTLLGGPDTDFGVLPENILWLQEELRQQNRYIPASVWLQVSSDNTSSVYWPKGFQRIFDGYIIEDQTARFSGGDGQSPQLVLLLSHWLSDLDATSAMSAVSHPDNPAQATFQLFNTQILPADREGEEGFSPDTITLAVHTGMAQFDMETLRTDFWGQAILPWLSAIAEMSEKTIGGLIPCLAQFDTPGETADAIQPALTAMQRIESYGSDRTGPYCVPLSFELDAEDARQNDYEILIQSIYDDIAEATLSTVASMTFWSKLLAMGSKYMFAVVPRIDTAIIAPLFTGSRETYAIPLDGITAVSQTNTLLRDIRAVNITAPTDINQTGNPVSSFESSLYTQLDLSGGCFVPDINKKTGMILVREAPSWINGVPAGLADPERVMQYLQPAGGSAESSEQTRTDGKGATLTSVAVITHSILERLAQWTYFSTVYAGRYVTVRTRLRLDIGPGSVVRFAINDARRKDAAEEYVGHVLKMSLSIDAEGAQAATQFQITGIRPLALNDSEAFSTEKHPLYTGKVFCGAPLADVFVATDPYPDITEDNNIGFL
jgi:hypothetical protein